MKKAVTATFIVLWTFVSTVNAQTDPEYKMEIGIGAGLMGYLGDFNGSLNKGMAPAWTILGKYRFNPRMAATFSITSGKLKGASKGVKTWYPELADSAITFNNATVDAGIRFEYNFWPYGTGREYRGAKVFTPYLTLGLGTTFASTQDGNAATVNLPMGVGVKYKLATRLNLSLEWMMHFSMSDKLDGTADPYGIKSSGLFKNTDCYQTFNLALTYDIWAKCKTCHNDYE